MCLVCMCVCAHTHLSEEMGEELTRASHITLHAGELEFSVIDLVILRLFLKEVCNKLP